MYVTYIGILPLYVMKEWNTILMFPMMSCGPFSVLWCSATFNTLCPTKPDQWVCIWARLVGPYVEKYHTSNPTWNRKAAKVMENLPKVRSGSYFACVCISNPNSGVTYWIFHKICKSRAIYIFQVKAMHQCTADSGAEVTMEVKERA